jgi:cytochrome b561
MPIRNSLERWGWLAQGLHWIVVALVATQFILANIAERLPLGMEKLATLTRHKSIGITILLLTILRLIWRFANVRPQWPATMRLWERRLAGVSHTAFYLLLIATPLAGWIMSSARNFPVSWFGIWQLPDLVAPGEALYRLAHDAHEVFATLLGAVAVLHLMAALKHHFVNRDNVLRSMLPFGKSRGAQ